MKNLLLAISIFLTILTQAQVGINTVNPEATLHIEGDLIVKDVPLVSSADRILVIDSQGKVKQISIDLIIPGKCPILDTTKSNGSYLLFTSKESIDNPNLEKIIDGLKFVSAGTWIQNNTYYYSYSNTTGKPLNMNYFKLMFNNKTCEYGNSKS